MNKKFKFSRKQVILLIAIALIVLAIIGITFLIKRLSPIKPVTKDNIKINLSTTKLTGGNVTASVTTTTKYDIFYYIQEKNEEVELLTNDTLTNSESSDENTAESNTTNTVTNNTSTTSKTKVENIKDENYKKIENGKIVIKNNSTIYLKYGKYGKLSTDAYTFKVNNIDKIGPEIGEIQVDTTDSEVTLTVNAFDLSNGDLTYYFKLSEDGEFICTENSNTYTFKELKSDETYMIFIKVKDCFGNESDAAIDATVTSKPKEDENENNSTSAKGIYLFRVNLLANTVTVYSQDENGEYTKPIKAMVCSTGTATPKSGKYKIDYKYRWLALFGGVFGQYATRIHGHILFHSVPYYRMYEQNSLEWQEYDKLGTAASAGCIRLTVQDAKWIYDNAKSGSIVEFYSDSNPGPLGKPSAQKISNSPYRDWDPTDPDSRNPWHGGNGIVDTPNTTVPDNNTNTPNNDNNNTNTGNNNNNNNNNNNPDLPPIKDDDDPANGPWD